ncbi:MAG: hypothetical protein HC831_04375 [Chloroflexia bacterium]|nr:hypothetical protein [Chloroflexia bacterium]
MRQFILVGSLKTPDNGVLLLSYDSDTRSSRLSKLDGSFAIQWQNDFKVNEDAEGLLLDHMIKTGKKYSFFHGSCGGMVVNILLTHYTIIHYH